MIIQKYLILLLLYSFTSAQLNCSSFNAELKKTREIVCASIGLYNKYLCDPPKDVKAHRDWPNQSVYMGNVITAISSTPTSCLNSSLGKQTMEWLNKYMGDINLVGSFMEAWMVFQVQYYDMPRKLGVRIETPWTLGMKCWAFAFLKEEFHQNSLENAVQNAGLELKSFIKAYNNATDYTIPLCERVMANCFVNATYDPSRNGTCPFKIDEFRAGFEWQNVLHGWKITWPFW